jgi:hypothetical protein
MNRLLLVLALLSLAEPAHAWPRGRRSSGYSTTYSSPAAGNTSTAQGVAEACARMGRLQHLGGNGSMMEGLGMSSTREGAYRSCCFANAGLQDADVGYAQTASGMWICCRRYR